ncbi:DUF3422 domain-containing protein [Alterisphingorhabdus coralli]|uniref:DUF3422 domain-containing protein n=1 Tax=Alterisphingorhabdus coralli TaxID=3071408 RepID=A0AA97F5Y6_9SPHN|nr:DUF3422 domain-containing protein [Parasphingorhabdus sp. SCSIO 66989]WOE74548.1 DUF3422 domain-containing protein [Parasphingorhabdus sp. SCSIO 66989]
MSDRPSRPKTANDHPLRQWAVDEMNLRRFAPVPEDCQIYQYVLLVDAAQRQPEDQYLINDRPDFAEWHLSPRSATAHTANGVHFLWERHTEASTITLILPANMPAKLADPYLYWLANWPGAILRATRVRVVPSQKEVDANLDAMGMAGVDMVCCDVNGVLRIWSDFGIHNDGFGRLLVLAGDVSDNERGRIIQRVQELGNYRNMALMGFPTVQEYGPQVDELEKQLSLHAEQVAIATDEDNDDALLQQLADISSRLELIRSATGFRLSATAAYSEVASDRLQALEITPVAGYQTLTEFTERRLVPATRTCATFQARLTRIAERISRVMHTLDVRIDTRIKAQNLSLTQSMERSTLLQLRLQTLVEGLSVIAAAYYLVGLIGYMVKGVSALQKGYWPEIIMGAVTVPVILIIWLFVHHLRGKVLQETESKKE